MLKLALVEKGVILPSSHYTLPGENADARRDSGETGSRQSEDTRNPRGRLDEGVVDGAEEEGGIVL
jgi:hypothetical protein